VRIRKEIFNYLVFGVLTTLVNIIIYAFLTKLLHIDYKTSTTVAWVAAVLFAYITNKVFVFQSASFEWKYVAKEFSSFLGFRFLSYLIDIGSMILLVGYLMTDDLLAKIFANIIVVIFNYVASKLFIFQRR
jgi:putative flippase GtrA